MKKRMMRHLAAVLVMLILLSLTACGEKFPKEYEKYVAPWKENVSERAKADGKIHYYFMSGEGMYIGVSKNYAEKWGDSSLIVFPNGETMLVDTGLKEYAVVLVENLKRMGIEKLDYFLMSHPHDDHAYGLFGEEGILESFPIGQVYINGLLNDKWGELTTELQDTCAENNTPVTVLKTGDKLEIGGVRLEVLNPPEGLEGTYSNETQPVNNSSLVIRLDYGEHSSLFTGDIYEAREKELVAQWGDKLDVDLLKIPHHGRPTSSTRDFTEAVTAELAVAMGGYPKMEEKIYWYYSKLGGKVLTDVLDGYVHVSSDGKTMEYETSRERTDKSYERYE